MSKAAQIRKLYAQGLGTREIAGIVGCSPEYVRVAGRQRNNRLGGLSPADIRWRAKNPEKVAYWQGATARRYREDPEYRRRHAAASLARYHKHKVEAAQSEKSQQPPEV